MKIAIDGSEAFRIEVTGIGVYARNLLYHLSLLDASHEMTYLGRSDSSTDAGFLHNPNLRLLRSFGNRAWWSQVRLPMHLIRNDYDVVHSLDHKLPFLHRGTMLVTIYDLAFFMFPETVGKFHLMRYRWFTRSAIHRATRIIAISNSTKADICRMFAIPREKVSVVHLGVDRSLYNENVVAARRPMKYILSVGTLQPRKNYALLIRAFGRVCDSLNEPLELIIVGKQGWLWQDIIAEARRSKYRERIQFLGYVPLREMPGLYAGAELFAMPSLYEGFGIPPLEAMACGIPVLASDASSLPEVVGDAGLLLNPLDEASWVTAIREVLTDRTLRDQLRKRGLARSVQFTWEKTAKETFSVYRSVCGHAD